MLDGKIFFGVTGIPIRKIALVKKALADAEPVPLTFAKRITKSFIDISLLAIQPKIRIATVVFNDQNLHISFVHNLIKDG